MQKMKETQVQTLSQEDPLEEGMATHSSIPALRTQGQRGLVGYGPWDHKELDFLSNLAFMHADVFIEDMNLHQGLSNDHIPNS